MLCIKTLRIKKTKGVPAKETDAVNVSAEKGIEGDLFEGPGNMQVSMLLAQTEDEIFALCSDEPCLNRFSSNLVVSGTDIKEMKAGTRLRFSDVTLELTTVGRECHGICALGTCPLVAGAIFARVLSSGTLRMGDTGIML